MKIKLNFDNLIKFLNKKSLNPTLQKETDQIYIVLTIDEQTIPLFFGIRNESNLLQLIAYLPFRLNDQAAGETARILHLLNRDVDMPGFGMDENDRVIFYRCVIPCFQQEIEEELLGMYIGTTRAACEVFLATVEAIQSGKAPQDFSITQHA